MNKKELNKKLKIYKLLGAEEFQKVVFAVEKIKFKILKKLCPNFIKYFDKYCDRKKRKELKKALSDEERRAIIKKYQFSKMAMRKEMNFEQNRNYHIDQKRPTEIQQYLEWNKSIHKKGLVKNLIILPLSIIGVITGFPFSMPILVYELFSTLINFECINIQNYNICRFKKVEPILKRREEREIQESIENYGEAAKVIHKSMDNTENLPTFEEIIANIKTPEQAKQMRELLLSTKRDRENISTKGAKK